MKKAIALILAGVLVLGMAGCQGNGGSDGGKETLPGGPGGEQVQGTLPEGPDGTTAPSQPETVPTVPETQPTEPTTESTTEPTVPETEPVTEPTEQATRPTEPRPTEPKPTVPPETQPKPTEPPATEPKPTEPKPTTPPETQPPETEPEPTTEYIDLAALEAYGNQYAVDTWGFAVDLDCYAGYWPPALEVIITMDEGFANVKEGVDTLVEHFVTAGHPIWGELEDGTIARCRINVRVEPYVSQFFPKENEYMITVYYG